MTDAGRAAVQLRADLKTFRRDPAAMFFTAVLPVLFLCLFAAIFGNERVPERGNVRVATLQVPALIALAVTSASFVSLAIGLTEVRESGVLKRTRGTPVPAWVVFAGRIGTAIVVAIGVTAVLLAVGALVFDVAVPTGTLPGLVLALGAGAAAFCALGIAITGVIPTVSAASALTNVIVLPLYFVSGVFIPSSELPDWLNDVSEWLPLKPLVDGLTTAFDPRTTAPGITWGDLGLLALWGLLGLTLALRTFRWTPRHAAGG